MHGGEENNYWYNLVPVVCFMLRHCCFVPSVQIQQGKKIKNLIIKRETSQNSLKSVGEARGPGVTFRDAGLENTCKATNIV